MNTIINRSLFSRGCCLLAIMCTIVLIPGCKQAQKMVYEKTIKAKRYTIGLQRKTLQISPTLTMVYLEHNNNNQAKSSGLAQQNDTIVLLHGFGGEKDNWLSMASKLAAHHRLIIPDLPGHGESSSPINGDYRFPTQVENVHRFTQQLGLKKFNLMGHSMGGGIAMLYAHKYPNAIQTLALISPAIFNPNEKSDFFKQLDSGHNPLIIKNPGDMDIFMSYLFVHQPRGFSFVKNYVESLKIERAALNQKIFNDLMQSKKRFRDVHTTLNLLHKIKMPIYLFWGDKDRVFNYDDTTLFQHSVPHLTVVALKNTGHGAPIEAANTLANKYLQLLRQSEK